MTWFPIVTPSANIILDATGNLTLIDFGAAGLRWRAAAPQ
jgi:hypothetical protein